MHFIENIIRMVQKKIFLDSHKVRVLKELKRLLINTILEQAGSEFGQDQLLGFKFWICLVYADKDRLSLSCQKIIVELLSK